MLRRFSLPVLLVSLTLLSLGGCAGKSVDASDPAQLYQDAEEEIKSDHYQVAIDKLRIIKNKFPYSKYSLEAQLKIADVLFLQESYAEAAASYETFRDLHPRHEKVSYAMFRAGKAYFLDIPDPISRDLAPAQKSSEAYGEFIKRFPTDPQADEARKDLAESRRILAEKELYIGDFYRKRDFPASAKPRYEKIVALYPDTPVAKEAQTRLAQVEKEIRDNPPKTEKPPAAPESEKK